MNKFSRLAALLMALLMLTSSVASAEVASSIAIERLDAAAYQQLVTAASEAAEAQVEEDEAYFGEDNTLSFPCDEMPEYCLFDEYSSMTATQMHRYFNEMYAEDGDGEISARYAAVMIHYGEYHLDSNLICDCGVHPLPEITVGDITEHELDCPWHFANLSVEEQYDVLLATQAQEQPVYMATLTSSKADALNSYMNSRAVAACGPENVGCTILAQMLELPTPQERYDFLMALEEMDYKFFIWHYCENHRYDGEICDCDLDVNSVPAVFAPGSDEHLEGCVWHKDSLAGDDDDDDLDIWDIIESIGNIIVSIGGKLPENVTLELDNASLSEAAQYVPVLSNFGGRAVALDISLMDGENEWQPESGEPISVQISADEIGEDGDVVLVYHIHDGETENLGTYTISDGNLTFDIDGFSTIVVLNCSDEENCFISMFAQMPDSTTRYIYLIDKYEKDRTWYDSFMAHYTAEHMDTNLICTCATPLIAPGVFAYSHNTNCPWHPNNDTVTLGNVATDGIQLTGSFPSNVDASWDKNVDPNDVLIFQEQLQDMLNPYKILNVVMFAYDDNNNVVEWQPAEGSPVKMTIDADGLGEDGDRVILYHVHVNSNGEQELEILGPSEILNGFVTFEVSRFSYMLFIGLDVDGGEVEGEYIPGAPFVPSDNPIYESTQEAALAGGENERSFFMPQSGKIELSVGQTGGHWQVLAGENWINVTGETGETFAVTYAKVKALYDISGSAKIRWISADGATVSETAVITIAAEAAAAMEEGMAYAVNTYAANEGIALAAEDGENIKHNVVVNYLFTNNETAASPYGAVLAAGSNFSATIRFPNIQGYLPYLGEAADSTTSLELNITNIQQDVVYYVYYKPTTVNYTVLHNQQNLDNDEYTLVLTETNQGLTESIVPEVAKAYDGFYALLYERPAIAADGSTIVEVYYDRYYYLMNFELSGGYGVDAIYDRYGAKIEDVGTPSRAGYTFLGWSLDGTNIVDLPETMPAENVKYIAVWDPDPTAKVTIVFWGENADDEAYSHLHSAEVYVKPGTEFTYDESGSLICGVTETHTHSAACGYACGKTEHTHSIQDSCYVLTCTEPVHNHDASCGLSCTHNEHDLTCYTTSNGQLVVTNEPDEDLTHIGNGIYRYWQGILFFGQYHYYLNIGGQWYTSSSGDTNTISLACSHDHTDECYNCGQTQTNHEHTIDGGCYDQICNDEEHVHSAACGYLCGKTEHQHTSSCYMAGAGLNSSLWKFVRSETMTVEADGSTTVNVYYDRVEKTLTFQYDYRNSRYNKTETITKKWGANISEEYTKIAENAGSTFWAAQNSNSGPYTNYFEIMPESSKTYYNRGKTGSTGSMQYWGEDLNGQYTVNLFTVPNVGGYTVTNEDRYSFDGFTYLRGTANGQSCSGATFYYTRNSYNLIFNDGYNDVLTESVKFEAPLETYKDFVPAAPSAYEPGSVEFAGWYLNPECTGDEFILEDHTMPSANVLLFAKWVPVERTVTFYLDRNAYDAKDTLDTHPPVTVLHGDFVTPTPADPENGDYTFVGWFYIDENGEEKAIDFANMPVNKDLEVFGKWSSNVLKRYIVMFELEDGTTIADPITGSTLAGNTRTFDAKGGEELYADYQQGYFPLVESHSMVLEINAPETVTEGWYLDEETGEIIQSFTFVYVPREEVPYIVRYVDTEGNALIDEKVVADNRNAVVTENFEIIPGFMPDAYQKRLVVTGETGIPENEWIVVEDDNGSTVRVHPDNVITFVYSKDTEHAYYQVTHYTQNLDRENWTEYASSQIIGDIGEYYTEKPMDISGFTYDHIEYVVNGQKVPADQITSEGVKLTEAGLEINLYYVRNEYPYIVRYLEQGTGTVLAEQKDSKGLYSDVVSESAIDIEHYTKLEPTTQTLSIRIDGELNPDGSIKTYPTLNIITFYYKENETQINYEIVGPVDGCGTIALNRNSSVSTNQLDTPISETNIPVLNGDAIGSTATANAPTFKFVGWYSDEACTQLVSADANFQPQKPDSGVWAETTYYAKFDYNIADLTIVKTIDKPDANTADDVFTFKVTLPEGTYAHDNATPDNTADDGTIVTTAQNPTAQIQITGQGALTIKGIVITSGYTVEEIDLPDGYAIANNPVTGTIAAGANTAAFANTYTTGQLIISKTVAGESAPTGDAADTFSYSVTLPKGTYAVAGMAGVTELVFAEGETKQFTFKHGDSVTISGIPTGADYTVTETAHEDYTVAPQSGAYTGDIAAETKAPFVNTFKYSDLLIHKDFSDNNASAKTLYKITAPDGYSQIVSITGEGSVLIDNLKVGVTYTIKELDTWSWRYTCADDEQEAMIVAEDTAEVTFVNTKKNDKWLDGEDSNENVFDAKTTN